MSRSATGLDFAKAALLSVVGSAATAFVYFAADYASLPASDDARQSFSALVAWGAFRALAASPIVGIGAVVAYFLWLQVLRERFVERSAVVVFGVVCTGILVATPWIGPNLEVAFLALVFGVLLARALPWTTRELSGGEPELGRAR